MPGAKFTLLKDLPSGELLARSAAELPAALQTGNSGCPAGNWQRQEGSLTCLLSGQSEQEIMLYAEAFPEISRAAAALSLAGLLPQLQVQHSLPSFNYGLRLFIATRPDSLEKYCAERGNCRSVLCILGLNTNVPGHDGLLLEQSPDNLPFFLDELLALQCEAAFPECRLEIRPGQSDHRSLTADPLRLIPSCQFSASPECQAELLSISAGLLLFLLTAGKPEWRLPSQMVCRRLERQYASLSREILRHWRQGKSSDEEAYSLLHFRGSQFSEKASSFSRFSSFLADRQKIQEEFRQIRDKYCRPLQPAGLHLWPAVDLFANSFVGTRLRSACPAPDFGPATRKIAGLSPDFPLFLDFFNGFRTLRTAWQYTAFARNAKMDCPPPELLKSFMDEMASGGFCSFASRYSFSLDDLTATLKKLGISRGMALYLQGNPDALARLDNDADTLLQACQKILTKAGSLMVPLFRHPALAQAARRLPGFVISGHPEHPVAIWGKDAANLAKMPGDYGDDSPLAALMAQRNCHLLFVSESEEFDSLRVLETARRAPCLPLRSGSCVKLNSAAMLLKLKKARKSGNCFLGNASLVLVSLDTFRQAYEKHFRPFCRSCQFSYQANHRQ